jgi:superoxide dismutase, Cu-Zn family
MRIICCVAINILIVIGLFPISGTWAEKQPAKKIKVERLFENFLRRGDLPWEFEISMRKTSTASSGAFAGSIYVRNTTADIGGHDEPALLLKAYLQNLSPGPHAMGIHQNPDCGPMEKDGVTVPGLAAGPRLFVSAKSGLEQITYKTYLGNLPSLQIREDGATVEEVLVPRLTLADLVNRSIVVNANQDGNSAAEACGVLH